MSSAPAGRPNSTDRNVASVPARLRAKLGTDSVPYVTGALLNPEGESVVRNAWYAVRCIDKFVCSKAAYHAERVYVRKWLLRASHAVLYLGPGRAPVFFLQNVCKDALPGRLEDRLEILDPTNCRTKVATTEKVEILYKNTSPTTTTTTTTTVEEGTTEEEGVNEDEDEDDGLHTWRVCGLEADVLNAIARSEGGDAVPVNRVVEHCAADVLLTDETAKEIRREGKLMIIPRDLVIGSTADSRMFTAKVFWTAAGLDPLWLPLALQQAGCLTTVIAGNLRVYVPPHLDLATMEKMCRTAFGCNGTVRDVPTALDARPPSTATAVGQIAFELRSNVCHTRAAYENVWKTIMAEAKLPETTAYLFGDSNLVMAVFKVNAVHGPSFGPLIHKVFKTDYMLCSCRDADV